MVRCLRLVLPLILILSVCPPYARAQYGWGWGGWGYGGGQTVQGAALQGYGVAAYGAGMYNQQTAVARSINLDTAIRWNEYINACQQNMLYGYVARRDALAKENKDLYSEHIKKLSENPEPRQIENGDALNRALDQLSNSRVQTSSLYGIAKTPIDPKTIQAIPFRYASEAVTLALSQVKSATKWPAALEVGEFAEDKRAFEETVDQARKEDEEGDMSPATIRRARMLIDRLNAKLDANPLPDVREQQSAKKFIKTFAGLVTMLEKPDTKEALDQLRKVEKTSVGNLISFMHFYGLRFGAATTPQQRMMYRDLLYPAVDDVRKKVLEASSEAPAAQQANAAPVHNFFNDLDLDKGDKEKKATPAPPPPQQ
jgi:hypothetical protein